MKAAIDAAVKMYQELGAELVAVSLPHTEYGIAAYYVIAPCEASSNLARYDGTPRRLWLITQYFDSFYNPNIQICGQCHAGGRGMRWDGSAYGLITNTVVSNYVTQAGYVPVTTYVTNVEVFTNTSYGYVYTNGASVGVTNITIATNRYVIPYATNQVWMASVTNISDEFNPAVVPIIRSSLH